MKGVVDVRVGKTLGWNPNIKRWYAHDIKGNTYDSTQILSYLMMDYLGYSRHKGGWKDSRTLTNSVHYKLIGWRDDV